MDGLGSLVPLITGASAGAGTLGNILTDEKRNAYTNFVMNLLKNPQQLAAAISKIQQPLNQGLTQAVGNQVQGSLAERGLAQAPGTFAASLSQGLAPFYQQNQQVAENALLSSLGLPAGAFGQPQNTSGSMQMFLNSLKKPSTGTWWNNVPDYSSSSGGLINDPSTGGDFGSV
jgi:hypothetical protein